MKEIEPVIANLSDDLEIDLRSKRSWEELKIAIGEYIDYLIVNDRNKLMRILYRVDVSEKLLKANLQQEEKNAASIIADMIVDRQLEKIESRRQFKSNGEISEDEKW
jgi:hypothetical protein